ncbi:MAG TPA: hypothetical protein VER33_09275 [Polyangiaceae bacterium]|nr:hypothetical protein [Polyangiaceae bacterium]
MTIENEDRWYVQFDSQEVRLMTLEELDEAFQQGLIHENTYLIQVGSSEWQTLADVAGLGSGEGPAEDEIETAALPPSQIAASLRPEPQPGPAAAPAPAAAHPLPQAQGFARVAAPVSAWPPVVAAIAHNSSAASDAPPSNALQSGRSMIPVVHDVSDLDVDASQFKRSRSSVALFAAAAVALLGGGAFALTQLDATPAALPPAAQGPVAAAALPRRPLIEPVTAAVISPAPAEAPRTETTTRQLSEDMKQALLDADKSRSNKRKSRAPAAASRRSGGNGSSGKSVFRSGGSADDPLNSNL